MTRCRLLAAVALVALLSPSSASADEPGAPSKAAVKEAAPSTEHRSTAMMATGISLTVTGVASAGLGAAAVELGSHSAGDVANTPFILAGAVSIGLGSALVLAGVPLWIVGARPRNVQKATSKSEELPIFRVAVIPALGGVSLVGSF